MLQAASAPDRERSGAPQPNVEEAALHRRCVLFAPALADATCDSLETDVCLAAVRRNTGAVHDPKGEAMMSDVLSAIDRLDRSRAWRRRVSNELAPVLPI